jgi:Fe-Mn family superoxide dismutase
MSENTTINEFGDLPYSYDALEPFIDKETMMVHHTKHHRGYYDKFLLAIDKTHLQKMDVNEILRNIDKIPDHVKTAVINNGGGYSNHNFFWDSMAKDSKRVLDGSLEKEIKEEFNDFENFKAKFKEKALTLFGSGWVWLVLNKENKLEIIQTTNQYSPLSLGLKPIICLDVWEHAYYLKYQNKRADYVDAFWNVVNWKQAEYLFNSYK